MSGSVILSKAKDLSARQGLTGERIMDNKTFIDNLIDTRAQWDALIAQIDEQWMLEPDVEGKWSVKDIIAHIL